jgi:Leucine-rich repeat (LRR) protein
MIALNHKHAISSSASSQTRLLTEAQTIELQVLTSLYHSSSGSTWTVSTSWLDEVSHCSWFGVTCDDDNHVSKIELSSNNLRGSVPLRALLRLPYLKVLKIDGNSVDSNIGEGVDIRLWEGMVFDDLTSSASVISSLQYIDLSHTDVLSGQISNLYSPSYIINPDQSSSPIAEKEVSYPYLNDLYLSGCDLRSAPSEKEWAKFGALERWVLDDNMMSGTVPSSLQMNNLRVFSANGNKLSGEMDGFGSLGKLRHLSLRGNQYHGSIPPGLRCDGTSSVGPKLLEILDLSNQGGNDDDTSVGLTGDLPSFSQCENLRRLDLSRNNIGGSFPADFLKLVDPLVFEEAMLNSNKIEGELPSSLSRFDADAIAVQDNRITELDEESLCDPHRSGAIAAFGCDAVLCPPGKYYPGTGRQGEIFGNSSLLLCRLFITTQHKLSTTTISEEAGEECRTCEGAKYWGAISCVDETFAIEPLPVSAPVQLPSSDEPAMAEEDQKTILMQLFESSGGQSWKHNNGWVRHDVISICDWWGVDCIIGTKSVERIDLQSNNLQGIVPTSIFQLPGLKELVLKDNSIFPTKANALDFFSEISKSSSLEILDLTSTGLSTVVGIENAPASLSELYLDSNPFGSSIPNEIFSLGHLKTLSMDNCNLSGSISNTIHQLGALMVLSASDNQLSGYLPPELSYLTSLSSIKLKNNRFSGTLPQTFNLLSALAYLDLSGQRQGGNQGLEGPLREFSEATKITRIDLSTNSFSGPVPGFFLASVDPDSFEFADLSDNMLVSSFPVGLG